jgi:hypothetical protein
MLVLAIAPPSPPQRSGFTGTEIVVDWTSVVGATDYYVKYVDEVSTTFLNL